MMKVRVIVATLVAILLTPILSIAGEVVFIGNPSVPVSELSSYEIENIFLGGKIKWKDGGQIVLSIQKKSPIHKQFLRKYIGKTPSQFSNYWKKQVFTGKGFAPKEMDTEQNLIDFVSQTAGAIGYVSSDFGLDDVKIISVK